MYALDGEPASAEMICLNQLPGYRGSTPVQLGNSAAAQLQLGAYGNLLDAIWNYWPRKAAASTPRAAVIAGIVDAVCDRWQNKDAGLWELGDYEHYTSSKIGCWVALDRGVRLAQAGQLPPCGWTVGPPSATRCTPGPTSTAGHPPRAGTPSTRAPTSSTPRCCW